MLKNVGSNWLLSVFGIGIAFFLTPFVIHTLGTERYGTWVLVASVTGYLSMLSLGIPMATVRFVAKDAAAGDQEAVNRTVGTCAGLYLIIGVASALVGAVLFAVWDRVYDIPLALRSEARWAFALVVLNISASFIGQLPYGILSAHQDFVTRNKVLMASITIRCGLTFALLSLDVSMVWLAVVQITGFVFEFTVASALVRRRYPGLRVRLSGFSPHLVREIFAFSAYVVILHAGMQLVFQSDSLVIGGFLPLSHIPHFAVASSLAVYLMEFVIGVGAVVMPTAAALQSQGRLPELRDLYLRWSKITVSLALISCAYLIVLGPRFIGWWIGPDFEKPSGEVLQILMAANIAFLPARGVALAVLMGLGKPRQATIAFLITGGANLALSLALVRPLGINGVAIGTAVPNVAFAAVVIALVHRELAVPWGEYLRYALSRTVIGAVPLFAFLLWLRDGVGVRGLAGLAAAGFATLGVGALIAFAYVFRGDERVGLERWLAARSRRVRP